MVGHFGVGKTSLVKQFVHNKFSDQYLSTIGVKVDKKVVQTLEVEVTMMLWDIEGKKDLSELPKSYFMGASGIIYVYDLSRPATFGTVNESLGFLKGLAPPAIIKVAGNKRDLLTDEGLKNAQNEMIIQPDFYTSAKTGDNVEAIFQALADEMVR